MLDAVVVGLGIGVLPCFITRDHRNLVCLRAVGGPLPEQIWLVTHPDALKLVRVRLVFDWLKEIFAQSADRLAGA
jgi:DNA-binding transcriptional LysR family regulator